MTDAERLKDAFKRAKTRVDKHNEEVERKNKEKLETFYQEVVESIFNFYENLTIPLVKTTAPSIYSAIIPSSIDANEILSLFVLRGFKVETKHNKSLLVFDFS
jgi:hypothetical protein